MEMKCRSWLVPCLLIGYGASVAGPGISLENQRITIPLTRRPPRIDGRIDEGEWHCAAMLTGLINLATKEYSHRQGHVWICWDAKGLYLAYRASFPAGRQEGGAWDEKALRAFERKRDGRVFADDSVEVYLAPKRPSQYVQFVGNSLGAIMDRRFGDVNWRGEWRFRNRVDNEAGLWELELAVTFDALGVPAPRSGDQWQFNFARTWRGLEKAYTSLTGEYRKLMATVVFSDASPAVRELSWGRPLAGQAVPAIDVENVSGRRVGLGCTYEIVTDSAEALAGARKEETIQLERGGSGRFTAGTTIRDPGRYAIRVTVREREGGTLLHDRTMPFAVYRPIGLKPFYVLKTRRLGVLVDLSKLPLDAVAAKATVALSLSCGDREIEGLAEIPVRSKQFPAYFSLPGSKLSGQLTVACRLEADGKSFDERVDYRIPPAPAWIGKYEVSDDFVPYPWTAVRVEDGPTVVCWGRRYVFGNTPLPRQILVGGQDVLADSVALGIQCTGEALEWTDEPVRVVQHSPSKVTLEKSARLGALNIHVQTTVEFDGFMWTTVTIDPTRPVEVHKIRIELPIRRECVRLFHVSGKWGEKLFGPVEKRAAFPALADERYYYWLGNDDVGLCWLTDTFAQWQDRGRAPRIGFEQTGGRYAGYLDPWRVNETMREPLKLSFGLQATPTRPPHSRRFRGLTCYNMPPEKLSYPVAKNADTIVEMSLKGKMNYPPFEADADRIRQWIAGYKRKGMKFLIYQYIDGGTETAAYRDYWGDWVTCLPPDLYQWRTVTAKCCLATSWSDYYCHVLDTMMKDFDADGIYQDGVMARPCQRGDAHGAPCTEDRWPVLVAREHLKKVLAVARRNKGRESVLFFHSSLEMVAPLAGLTDVHLKGENYGAPLSYDDLTPDVMRAEFGRQWGPQSILLPQLTKKQIIPTGRLLGLIALHDVDCAPSFLPPKDRPRLLYPMWRILDEFPIADAEFMPYFKQRLFTEASGRPISLYRNSSTRRCLLVVANQTAEPTRFVIDYHPAAPMRRITERFSGRAVPFHGNRFAVELDAWGLQLLEVSF